MKLTNTLATTMLAAFLAVGLSACGKKKNSSNNNAATPGSACIFNPQTGQHLNSAGQQCSPTATQITCPAAPNNYYTNNMGQTVQCAPGQLVTTGGYNYPGQYPPGYQNQTGGCDSYALPPGPPYYGYGVPYVPAVINGVLQCLRYDLANQYTQGTPYYNNYDYYYAYPPYQYQQGSYCGTQVAVNFGGFSGAMCF